MAWHQMGAKSLSNSMGTKFRSAPLRVPTLKQKYHHFDDFFVICYKGCCNIVSGQQGGWVIKFNSLSGSEKKDQKQWFDLNQEV